MADNKDKILAMVEAALKKNPTATTEELQGHVKKRYPSVGPLTKRQFNARYVLQIKRRKPEARTKKAATAKATPKKTTRRRAPALKKPSRPRRTRRAVPAAAAAPTVDRDEVRQQFLRFASDIAAAEARKDLVKVLASVDKYVDAVAKAVS